jgi:hypothetical protein
LSKNAPHEIIFCQSDEESLFSAGVVGGICSGPYYFRYCARSCIGERAMSRRTGLILWLVVALLGVATGLAADICARWYAVMPVG